MQTTESKTRADLKQLLVAWALLLPFLGLFAWGATRLLGVRPALMLAGGLFLLAGFAIGSVVVADLGIQAILHRGSRPRGVISSKRPRHDRT
jgi:hypothetical protein